MRSTPILDTDKTATFEAPVETTHAPVGTARRVGAFLLRELREMLPPTIFFFIGFNLIVLNDKLARCQLWRDIWQLHAGHRRGACGRKSSVNCQCNAIDPPLRSRATDPTDPVQGGILLGRRLCRAPARTLDPLLACRRPSTRDLLAALGCGIRLASFHRDPALDIRAVPDL